jgi:hypothetical protein
VGEISELEWLIELVKLAIWAEPLSAVSFNSQNPSLIPLTVLISCSFVKVLFYMQLTLVHRP